MNLEDDGRIIIWKPDATTHARHAPDYRGTHLALARVTEHNGDKSTARHEFKLASGQALIR